MTPYMDETWWKWIPGVSRTFLHSSGTEKTARKLKKPNFKKFEKPRKRHEYFTSSVLNPLSFDFVLNPFTGLNRKGSGRDRPKRCFSFCFVLFLLVLVALVVVLEAFFLVVVVVALPLLLLLTGKPPKPPPGPPKTSNNTTNNRTKTLFVALPGFRTLFSC